MKSITFKFIFAFGLVTTFSFSSLSVLAVTASPEPAQGGPSNHSHMAYLKEQLRHKNPNTVVWLKDNRDQFIAGTSFCRYDSIEDCYFIVVSSVSLEVVEAMEFLHKLIGSIFGLSQSMVFTSPYEHLVNIHPKYLIAQASKQIEINKLLVFNQFPPQTLESDVNSHLSQVLQSEGIRIMQEHIDLIPETLVRPFMALLETIPIPDAVPLPTNEGNAVERAQELKEVAKVLYQGLVERRNAQLCSTILLDPSAEEPSWLKRLKDIALEPGKYKL